MIAQPAPRQDVLARRDAIVAGLRALLPESGVIAEELRLKPYETDGLSAYRQVPLAVVLPETTEQVAAVMAFCHREGVRVILNGRRQASVDAALARLHAAVPGARAEGLAADVGTPAGCAALTERFPDIDLLVNNTGIFDPRPFEDIADDEWQHMIDVNVMSGVRLSRHYVKGMKARNWGRIIFISSESGLNIPAEMVHYGMSKAAQLAVSRGIAETTAGTGVTVNAVLPGPTWTEGAGDFFAKLAKEQGVSL